jgi:hypothetical protein
MRSSDAQVRRLFMAIAEGDGVERAAMRAGMHRNTARRHIERRTLPSDPRGERTWRTRPDPFEEHWPQVEARLAESPGLLAKTLFDDLVVRHPGRYGAGQLRTLQRRVQAWRARSGPEKEIFFPQEHRPGEAIQTDFTWTTSLRVRDEIRDAPQARGHAEDRRVERDATSSSYFPGGRYRMDSTRPSASSVSSTVRSAVVSHFESAPPALSATVTEAIATLLGASQSV